MKARRVAALCVVALWSCAPSPRRAALEEALAPVEGDERDLAARRGALRDALSATGSPPPLGRVELRVEDVRVASPQEGARLELRVPLESPWALSARGEEAEAALAREAARLDAEALSRQELRCRQEAEGRAAWLARADFARQEEALALLERWEEALLEERHLTQAQARRARLARGRRRLRAAPPEWPPGAPEGALAPLLSAGALPPLARGAQELDAALEGHPEEAEALSEAWRWEAQAEEADAGRLPWLQWFAVSGRAGEEGEVTAQASVALPLGLEEGPQAEAARAKARAARWRAEGARVRRRAALEEALGRLADFEASGPRLLALEADAERLEHEALAALQGRAWPLEEVEGALEEAHALRRALLERRLEASVLACALWPLAGRPLSAWPRR